MAISFDPEPFRGAYLIEARHLLELDNILDRQGTGRKTVGISLKPNRSCSLSSFAELAEMDLVEKYVVTSISGQTSSETGRFSISISGLGTWGARIRYSANATETAIDSFEKSVRDFAKRVRAPYYLLYETTSEFIISLFYMILLMLIMLYGTKRVGFAVNMPDWQKIVLFSTAASILGQVTMYGIKRTLPPFSVLIGEGARWHQRTVRPWNFLIPRAAWQMILVCTTILIGWAVYQHR